MDIQEIKEIVDEFLVEEFEADRDQIIDEGDLVETLDLDSLDYVDLVVILDSKFGFKAKGEEFQTIKTFGDFYRFIQNKVNSK